MQANRLIVISSMVLVPMFACHGARTPGETGATVTEASSAMPMAVTTTAFSSGAVIPKGYTCDGADISPDLSWSGAPAEVRSFALIADDPDAPGGTWTHWLIWNISASSTGLPRDVLKDAVVDENAYQGQNDFGRVGYGGPCPPPGKPHRYFFSLYALDAKLNLKPGAKRKELEQAIKGHVLAQGKLMGRYGR